jgi:membrane-anchored protein YejM (alkaline phosphatase superfamily)
MDAPHGGGDYDPATAKFFPHVSEINYLALNKERDSTPYLNHYKNAIYFDDIIIGNVLDMLDDRGLSGNTVIMMTGDHGEEFYERGYWGHNGAFTPEQIKVPFVMGGPGVGKGRVDRLTSHTDLAPTILELIGCNTPAEQYSQGISMLLDQSDRDYVVSTGWDEFALIDTAVTLVLSSEMYNMAGIKVYDGEYNLITEHESDLESRLPYLRDVIGEFSRFYQR